MCRVQWCSMAVYADYMRVASTLLIAYTDKREALVYSLPYLEHMHSLQITQSSNE